MSRLGRLSWWLWLSNGVALGASLAGWTPGVRLALMLAALHVLHQGVRTRGLWALAVQVRFLNLAVMLLGSLWLRPMQGLQLAGMAALVVFDYCVGSRMLSLLPWNRRRPLTVAVLRATLFTPPRPPQGGGGRHVIESDV
jgi:hypothetical protein